jgi:hypothetical protein
MRSSSRRILGLLDVSPGTGISDQMSAGALNGMAAGDARAFMHWAAKCGQRPMVQHHFSEQYEEPARAREDAR